MTTAGRIDLSRAAGAMQVEHCDVPLGMTLCEWRRRGGPLAASPAAGSVGDAATPAERSDAARPRRNGLRRALRLA